MDRSIYSFVGTAGWSIPKAAAQQFPVEGTHLQRYAQVLNCVEINSSFYRSHATRTYERWAASTPTSFRFAVKMPRTITHDQQLRHCKSLVEHFLDESGGLGAKLGPLLMQLPPSLVFEPGVVSRFLVMLRQLHDGAITCEPRHASWFTPQAENMLSEHHVSRVAADPPVMPQGGMPAADVHLVYYRLHGVPRTYWSNYSSEVLPEWASSVISHSKSLRWVIFDNTAAGCATANAIEMRHLLEASSR